MILGNGTFGTVNARGRRRFMGSLALAAGITTSLVLSSWTDPSRLGVPVYWPWLLTGLQVLSLWAAGARRRWRWPLGAAVQPPWIAYAFLTGQIGFIPGCAISAAVQTYSYLRVGDRNHLPRGNRPGNKPAPLMAALS